MQDDEARALTRRWWERVWREGDVDVVDEILTDPYTRHTSAGNQTVSLAEYKRVLIEFQRVLHGAVTTIDDEVIAGDKIWTRATSRGVNLETTELGVLTWLVVHRVEGGKLAEIWVSTLPGVDWER